MREHVSTDQDDDDPAPSTTNAHRDSRKAPTNARQADRRTLLGRGLKYAIYFAVAAAIFALVSRRNSGPAEGVVAADFELPTVTGSTFHLAAQHGHPVVIDVFASWCPVCRQTAPMLDAVYRTTRARKVQFVGISVDDSAARASAVKRDWHIPYPVLHDDGRFSRLYKIRLLPTIIVIDAEGRVRHVATGNPGRSTLEGWLSDVGAAAI